MACVDNNASRQELKTCPHCGGYKPRDRKFCGRSCSALYRNAERAGRSLETLWERFLAKVDLSKGQGPNGDCWEWTGRVDGRGYGEMKIRGRYVKAHRIALFGEGVLDRNEFACHKCDNPRCVKPAHLFAGEAVDNVRDMIKKGRARFQKAAGQI